MIEIKKKINALIKQIRKKLSDFTPLAWGCVIFAFILIVTLTVLGVTGVLSGKGKDDGKTPAVQTETTAAQIEIKPEESVKSAEEIAKEKRENEIDEAIASYGDIGIVSEIDDGGYLNVRSEAAENAEVIGKLYGESACSIIGQKDDWYQIKSGEIEGYVKGHYVVTGDKAKELARQYYNEKAVVTTPTLYIRTEPSTDGAILGTVHEGERYKFTDITDDGWIHIDTGYISGDYAEIKECLLEAMDLDLSSQVVKMYDNLGISSVDTYLNIRQEPGENKKIIGKLPNRAGADILEEKDGWYRIQSGPVKGWVKSDYIVTGNTAIKIALNDATLMAVVKTDVLNVRKEPSVDSEKWTQIINEERYPVVNQLDGWVEIDLGDTDEEGNETTAFVSNQYVDIKYALPEAIKFSPLEERLANAGRLRTSVCSYALQFVGNPYVWGGTSLTKGCDCSGFTMKVFAQFGVRLDHYSGTQAKTGKGIKSSDMRPGDIICYSNSAGTINHVAIYIGNGQIVHAANRRSGIKISSWNYRTPKAIRNVLGD